MVTIFLRTRSFKEIQQLCEQRFWDRVSPTKMTIWKNVKKYTLKDQGKILTKIVQVAGEQNVHRKTIIFKKSLSRIQEYEPERMVWTLIRVHLTESQNGFKWHPHNMHVRKERIINEVDSLKKKSGFT